MTKKLALVSLDFDKRAKSCEGLKFRGQTAKKIFTDGSLAEINRKKKTLNNERSLTSSKQRTFSK